VVELIFAVKQIKAMIDAVDGWACVYKRAMCHGFGYDVFQGFQPLIATFHIRVFLTSYGADTDADD
jgi:hypothetical protein